MHWQLFRLGWFRRSAMILDEAGCPLWLIRLRCPVHKGWGILLDAILKQRYMDSD